MGNLRWAPVADVIGRSVDQLRSPGFAPLGEARNKTPLGEVGVQQPDADADWVRFPDAHGKPARLAR